MRVKELNGVSAKAFCTIKTGGILSRVWVPESAEELRFLAEKLPKTEMAPFYLGLGGNTLFPDGTLYRPVVSLRKCSRIIPIDLKNGLVYAECGVLLSALAAFAEKNALGGAEALSGIPGTTGGAAVMNAGAFYRSFADICVSVDTDRGRFSAKECGFSYRKSRFQTEKTVVFGATLRLYPEDPAVTRRKTEEYKRLRAERQPQNFPSAGSVFRGAEGGVPAWKYLDGAGLRGRKIGGATFSEKHANFIVNTGGATTSDVEALIGEAKMRVYEKFGVKLVEEIVRAYDS